MHHRLAACLICIFWLTLSPARAQALDEEWARQIEQAVEAFRQEHLIPGMSAAIAVEGRPAYARGFGRADLEHDVPATEETVYRTASIAKPMTAVAVMQLADDGKLDLDAPIQRYCPAYPEKEWPVTARRLLGHLGGVRHYNSGEEATGKEHYYSITQALGLFKDDPLLHQPGTKFHYSTYGYNLLGCVVEGASGQDYEAYMTEKVFRPAGMTQTVLDNTYRIVPHRARGYMRVDQATYDQLPEAYRRHVEVGTVVNASLHDTSMKVPGGGLLASAGDLVRFALAVRDAKLLPRETVERMWTAQQTAEGESTGYGLGWGVADLDGQRLVVHSGGQAGTATRLAMLPERGIVIALMCNLQQAPLHELVGTLGKLLLEREAAAAGR